MIDDRDVEKLKETFVTRVEMHQRFDEQGIMIQKAFDDQNEYIDHRLGEGFKQQKEYLDLRLEEGFREQKNFIVSLFEKYFKGSEDRDQEHAMLANKVDRHDRWIHELADKQGMRLE